MLIFVCFYGIIKIKLFNNFNQKILLKGVSLNEIRIL